MEVLDDEESLILGGRSISIETEVVLNTNEYKS